MRKTLTLHKKKDIVDLFNFRKFKNQSTGYRYKSQNKTNKLSSIFFNAEEPDQLCSHRDLKL